MRPSHHKGPQQQPGKADPHADPRPVSRTVKRVIKRPQDQYGTGDDLYGTGTDHDAKGHNHRGNQRDSYRMTDRDWDQRLQHDPAAAPMQPKSDREQPAHRWVQAVVGAEPSEREPWPCDAHYSTRPLCRRGLATEG